MVSFNVNTHNPMSGCLVRERYHFTESMEVNLIVKCRIRMARHSKKHFVNVLICCVFGKGAMIESFEFLNVVGMTKGRVLNSCWLETIQQSKAVRPFDHQKIPENYKKGSFLLPLHFFWVFPPFFSSVHLFFSLPTSLFRPGLGIWCEMAYNAKINPMVRIMVHNKMIDDAERFKNLTIKNIVIFSDGKKKLKRYDKKWG